MKSHKKHLEELTQKVSIFIAAIDVLMKEPSSAARGKKIGKALNYLDMANDSAMHFGLDYGFKKIENFKKKAEEKIK